MSSKREIHFFSFFGLTQIHKRHTECDCACPGGCDREIRDGKVCSAVLGADQNLLHHPVPVAVLVNVAVLDIMIKK